MDIATAVDTFDRWHDDALDLASSPTYRAPLPAAPPGPGEQYRFEVDLDACTGCKACVSACHSLNGLDEHETWRSVGLLVGAEVGAGAAAWQQHVTTACHHCLEPACLAGCPVDAYEKDPITGIVAHLDDQCIGCRYCMLTCPYEVPSYNSRLGVVRKCDMCTGRLAEGEAPACVQGCPTDAISIGVVATATVAAAVAADPSTRVVPTAPRSAGTTPTTVYLTRRPRPAVAVAADDHRVVPAANHPPLVAMLVLTQLSVGAFVVSQLAALAGVDGVDRVVSPLAWITALVAIAASVLHLGRPLVAWRAVLGLRHSWLSREIVAFGAYAALGGATAAATSGVLLPASWASWLGGATAVCGIAGVVCSAQLYAVTGRPFWRIDRTLVRFVAFGGASGAAVVAAAASTASSEAPAEVVPAMTAVVVGAVAAGAVAAVSFVVRHRGVDGALGRSAHLLTSTLASTSRWAIALAVAGAALAVAAAVVRVDGAAAVAWWGAGVVALVASGWLERVLFFTASSPDRMPGGPR